MFCTPALPNLMLIKSSVMRNQSHENCDLLHVTTSSNSHDVMDMLMCVVQAKPEETPACVSDLLQSCHAFAKQNSQTPARPMSTGVPSLAMRHVLLRRATALTRLRRWNSAQQCLEVALHHAQVAADTVTAAAASLELAKVHLATNSAQQAVDCAQGAQLAAGSLLHWRTALLLYVDARYDTCPL
jgi:hypothetical protein